MSAMRDSCKIIRDLPKMDSKNAVSRNAKKIKLVSLMFSVVALTGCASFGIGEDEYSCSGVPDGTRCMSARDVYNNSNDGKAPRAVNSDEDYSDYEPQRLPTNYEVYADYVAPRLPNQPIPVRTPAKVMRIWVAPWEDTNGDLIVSGHIYTEIESRKWVLGEKLSSTETPSLFQPLQVNKPSK